MSTKKFLGIDIGGTNTTLGIVDESGHIHHSQWLLTDQMPTINSLVDNVKNYLTLLNIEKEISGIGIGAAAGNYKTGTINHSANLPWKGIVPIVDIFSEKFNCPIAVSNDANATALGEKFFGAAKNLSNFVVITLGTGVGAGIIINNQIVSGFDGNGGEFGHTILIQNGRKCGCGRQGCLETYTSAKGILATAHEIFSNHIQETTDLPQTAKEVYNLAIDGHISAINTFNKVGNQLGFAIANLVSLLGLEHVFLFGGPVAAGELLLAPTRKAYIENVLHFYKDVPISPSELPLRDAALLGAASTVAAFRM